MKEEKKRMAVEAMGLPKDVLLGDVLVRFTGFHEVRIQAKTCRLALHGQNLGIRYYNQDSMGICGHIHSLEFEPVP